jgi:hypothetical protein
MSSLVLSPTGTYIAIWEGPLEVRHDHVRSLRRQ